MFNWKCFHKLLPTLIIGAICKYEIEPNLSVRLAWIWPMQLVLKHSPFFYKILANGIFKTFIRVMIRIRLNNAATIVTVRSQNCFWQPTLNFTKYHFINFLDIPFFLVLELILQWKKLQALREEQVIQAVQVVQATLTENPAIWGYFEA